MIRGQRLCDGPRMQLLRRVAKDGEEDQRRSERLTFPQSFLNDATPR